MFKRRVRQIPDPPKPCKVLNKGGFPYSYIFMEGYDHEVLMIEADETIERFPSHARAHSAIHHTIEYRKSKGQPWSLEDFQVIDVP